MGLATLGDLRRVPRDSLAARYGAGLPLRLDRAFGLAAEPLTPHRPAPPYRGMRAFAEPIGTTAAVARVLVELLTAVCLRLEKDHRGARRFQLDCHRVDGSAARLLVRTSKPNRSVTHLGRLFEEKMNSLDAGFGIEIMVLNALDIDAAAPVQMALAGCGESAEQDTSVFELLDRLGLRLGFEHVCRFHIRESLVPESSTELVPAAGAAASRRAPSGRRTASGRCICSTRRRPSKSPK